MVVNDSFVLLLFSLSVYVVENVKVEDNKAITLDIEMTSASKSLGVVVVSWIVSIKQQKISKHYHHCQELLDQQHYVIHV